MKKIFILAFLSALFVSCSFNDNQVIVNNNSESTIDSVLVYGNQNCKPLRFVNIKKNTETKDYFKNCDKEGNDGSFKVVLYIGGKETNQNVGYYSNGYAIFSEIFITVETPNDIEISFN